MRYLSTTLGALFTSLFLAGCGAKTPPATPATLTASPAAPTPTACESGPLDAARVHGRAADKVVRVVTPIGTGSGFVVGDGADQLVVTNYHVIKNAESQFAEMPGGDGRPPKRVALDVVKVDREQDLALLRPSADLGVAGLPLRKVAVEPGESIVVLGYPNVAGSAFELTLEPGSVTLARRELAGRARVQTNANINPGNSGGPMLDACGRVVGVVSARHVQAARVGLAVPVEALERLLVAARAPRLAPEVEARSRIEEFLKAVRFRDNARAATFFGREFLVRRVEPVLGRLLKSADEKARSAAVEAQKDPDMTSKLLSARLTPPEASALEIRAAVKNGKLAPHAAPEALLAGEAADVFGEVQQVWVETVTVKPEGCVDAGLTVRGKNELRRYVVHMHDRSGEWVIDGFRRAR